LKRLTTKAHETPDRRPISRSDDADTGGGDATTKELKMAKKLDDIMAAMPAQRSARVEGRAMELAKLQALRKAVQRKPKPGRSRNALADA